MHRLRLSTMPIFHFYAASMTPIPTPFSKNKYHTAAHSDSDQDCSWAADADEFCIADMGMGVGCVFHR